MYYWQQSNSQPIIYSPMITEATMQYNTYFYLSLYFHPDVFTDYSTVQNKMKQMKSYSLEFYEYNENHTRVK